MSKLSSWIVVGLAVALARPAPAQDWPQWRGPARDGIAAGAAARPSWPAGLRQAWRVTAGIGHSSPLLIGSRAYLFAREGDREVLTCLELDTGKTLWSQGYPAPYTMHPAATSHGLGPKSTPAAAAGRVFTLGISGILSAWDAASGRPLWRHDFGGRFKSTSPLYGAAMSPLADAESVFAHVGGQGDGALQAFDAASGAARWAWSGDGPGYASPVLATIAGARQLVTQTQRRVVGLAADTGALLWSIPFDTPYEQNAVTPVVAGDVVIYSGLDQGIQALRVSRRGAGFAAEPLWSNQEQSAYLSTPVLDGGVLYGLSHKKKGQYFALDAATGRTLWVSEGRQAENAAIVAAADALLLLTTDATLIVARKDPKAFAVLRSYTVAATPTWAHPALSRDRILVKDRDSLTLWRVE